MSFVNTDRCLLLERAEFDSGALGLTADLEDLSSNMEIAAIGVMLTWYWISQLGFDHLASIYHIPGQFPLIMGLSHSYHVLLYEEVEVHHNVVVPWYEASWATKGVCCARPCQTRHMGGFWGGFDRFGALREQNLQLVSTFRV